MASFIIFHSSYQLIVMHMQIKNLVNVAKESAFKENLKENLYDPTQMKKNGPLKKSDYY